MHGLHGSWRRIDAVDTALAVRFNRVSHYRLLRTAFAAVSRAGDGVFWYVLMGAMIAADGYAAVPVVLRMLIAGALGLALYKWLKVRTLRPRPYQVHPAVHAASAPLDQFSFPSGHTLHAACFATLAAGAYPGLAPLVYGFALLVGVSRPVLGLHYPSDVLAGAAIGWAIAQCALAF